MSLNDNRSKVFTMHDRHEVAIVLCEGSEQPVSFQAATNGHPLWWPFSFCGEPIDYSPQVLRRKIPLFSAKFVFLHNQALSHHGKERKAYYVAIEKTQHQTEDSDLTLWLEWFLNCLKSAILWSEHTLQSVMEKASFWSRHSQTAFNERQIKILNRLLDGDFRGKLQSSKWAKMCKCSQDTTTRDLKDLVEKGILVQEESGRNTNYKLQL